MSESVFRIVVTAAVALASLAFVVQACVVVAFYRSTRKMQTKVSPLLDRVEPLVAKLEPMMERASALLEKTGPAVDKIGPMAEKATLFLASANRTMEENRPKIS